MPGEGLLGVFHLPVLLITHVHKQADHDPGRAEAEIAENPNRQQSSHVFEVSNKQGQQLNSHLRPSPVCRRLLGWGGGSWRFLLHFQVIIPRVYSARADNLLLCKLFPHQNWLPERTKIKTMFTNTETGLYKPKNWCQLVLPKCWVIGTVYFGQPNIISEK